MDIQEKIYRAQCFGNVEPIEHMVPYPNLPALVEGETVKFSHKSLFPSSGLTIRKFQDRVHQAANWLEERGVKKGDHVIFEDIPKDLTKPFAFATWLTGATLGVISHKYQALPDPSVFAYIFTKDDVSENPIEGFSIEYNPRHKPLLTHEACIVVCNDRHACLSHYQILVNLNGIAQGMGLHDEMTFHSKFTPFTLPWMLMECLLPFYTGAVFTSNSPDITMGFPQTGSDPTYVIVDHWKQSLQPTECFLLPEAGGILMIGEDPIHLMNVNRTQDIIHINGHGVMMGYLEEALNPLHFSESSFSISI